MVQKSSSLWGCELKSSMMEEKQLIVRHPPCEDVSWKIPGIQQVLIDLVILLVRMWVEKLDLEAKEGGDRSSSMWGCELKSKWFRTFKVCRWLSSMWGCELKKRSSPRRSVKCRHPPCEDVSWKGSKLVGKLKGISHPPCEDVSWKENDVKMYGTQV